MTDDERKFILDESKAIFKKADEVFDMSQKLFDRLPLREALEKKAAREAGFPEEPARCWIFHKWDKWSIIEVDTNGRPFQTRKCIRCNLAQVRKCQ